MKKDLIDLHDAIRKGEKLPLKDYSPAQRGIIIEELRRGFEQCKRQVHSGYLYFGMYWNACTINKIHRFWGNHIKNDNDLIKELNIGVSKSLLNHYRKVWQVFGSYLQERDLYPPVSRLIAALPIMEEGTDVAGWAEKAAELPHDAYMDAIREAKGMITSTECLHELKFQEVWQRCNACGKFWKVVNA